MAKKIQAKNKTSVSQTTPKTTDHPFKSVNSLLNRLSSFRNFRSSKSFYIVLIVAGILLLAMYKKNWFVAAIVNGSPVTNLELQIRLNQQFRTQVLNQLVNEKIILNEAAKNNIRISDKEVVDRISEIETSVGGSEALDTLLSQQGQSRITLKDQIRIQLIINKLYENEATVSAEEVTQFIEENREQLRATESASQQKEASEALKNQKLSQLFSEKFQDLRQKAKIQIF